MVFIVEQNLVGISTVMLVVFCHRLKLGIRMTPQGHYMKTWRHPPNRKYITSQRRPRRTDPWPQAARTKFGEVRPSYVCGQTEKQKFSSQHTSHPPPGGEVTIAFRKTYNWY